MILPKDGFVPQAEGKVRAPSSPPPLPIGARIDDLSLLEILGSGPQGAVYLAASEKQRGFVAVKALQPGTRINRKTAYQLLHGNRKNLSHPNIAPVFQYGESSGVPFYVRAYLRGDSLQQILDGLKRGRSDVPHLSPFQLDRGGNPQPRFYASVARIFSEVAGGLQLAHDRGIHHGRLHAANLIFSPTGRLVIADFGSLLEDAMPAETDAQGDVLALGALLHHLVYGEPCPDAGVESSPGCGTDRLEADDLPGRGAAIAPEFRAVIARALSPDRARRYPTAKALREDLKKLSHLAATGALERAPQRSAAGEETILPAHRFTSSQEALTEVVEIAAVEMETASPELPGIAEDTLRPEAIRSFHPAPAAEAGPAALDEGDLKAEDLQEESAPYPEPFPGPAHSSQPARNGRAVMTGAALFLTAVAAGTWISLYFQELSGLFRSRAVELERGTDKLQTAVSALLANDSSGAAAALAGARPHLERGRVLEPEDASASRGARQVPKPPSSGLDAMERRLRTIAEDPVAGGLLHPQAEFRLLSIERLESEIENGQRSASDLRRLAGCFWDDHPAVRVRAIRACGRAALAPLLLESFPIGPGKPALALDAPTFAALYGSLAEAAIQGSAPAIQAIGWMPVEDLERLQLAFESAGSVAAGVGAAADGAAFETGALAMQPNLAVGTPDDARQTASIDLLADWMRVQGASRDPGALEKLARFENRSRSLPAFIGALEQIGTPRGVETLRRLLQRQALQHGFRIIEALARAGGAAALLEIATTSLPLPLRQAAVERTFEIASENEAGALAALAEKHPEPEIRGTALAVLARRQLLPRCTGPLLAALNDPALRNEALDILDGLPVRESIPLLLEVLESADAALRGRVAALLGAARSPDLLLPLARQLFENSGSLRRSTLEALALYQDDRALALAVGALDGGFPGLEELALALLGIPEPGRRENPAILVLALQQLFDLQSPEADSARLKELRRAILMAPLGSDPDEFDRLIPERIHNLLDCPK